MQFHGIIQQRKEGRVSFQTYIELNELLGETLFTEQNRNRAAYIELDEDLRSLLAESMECAADEVIPSIQRITSEHYKALANPSEIFRIAAKSITQWRKKVPEDNSLIYPELPMLVCLTSAALDMGGDSEFNSLAYYPRLAVILDVEEKDDLAASYRDYSKMLWGNWNYWLDVVLNSERGIGTAYSIGSKPYVGFALSQALVRSGDRKKLPALFRKNGLSRNASVSSLDMQSVLDDWIASVEVYSGYDSAPSKPFQNLWKHPEARPRMSEIVCRELELWDGRIPQVRTAEGLLKDDIQIALEATIATFGGVQVKFSFGVSGIVGKKESRFKILDSEGSYSEISMVADSSGWMYPNVAKLPISSLDLLEKSITGKFDESIEVTRAPKRIAILRLDQATRRFREIERAEMHTRMMILVNNHKSNIEFVRNILLDSARTGFKEMDASSMKGIPENWVVFTDVELVQIPSQELLKKHVLLEALRPNRTGDLTLSAGFQLPGNPPKWHQDFPIEVRAFVVGAHTLKLQISHILEDERIQILDEKFTAETFIRSFDSGFFEDGRYEIHIFVDDSEEPFATKVFRIASSDSPDAVTWKRSDRLVYAIGKDGNGLFSATSPEAINFDVIDGPFAVVDTDPRVTQSPGTLPAEKWWSSISKAKAAEDQELKLNTLGTSICFENGTHHWDLAPALPNSRRDGHTRTTNDLVDGQCKNCGIKKMFPATHWRALLRADRLDGNKRIEVKQTSKVDVGSLPNVTDFMVTWDMALDALMHLGGGSESYISALAANIDSSPLFRHNFTNTLEDLGHIDVARDSNAQVIGWEINPTFAAVINTEIHLLGYWPKSWKKTLMDHFGASFVLQELEDSVSQCKLVGISVDELLSVCNHQEIDVNVTEESAEIMIAALPEFLIAIEDLPDKQAGLYEEVSKYDANSNSWLPGNDFEGAGGYRLKSAYKVEYCIVTKENEDFRKFKCVSSATAKHFESILNYKRPLFGFVEGAEQLFVPVGAPLPGLYQRAAVLASGAPPLIDSSGKLRVYENISTEFALTLLSKMGA